MDVGCNLSLVGIEMNAKPRVELLQKVEEGDHIFYIVSNECFIVGVPLACKLNAT